ncbi:MAG: AAA family ATPase [Henriciella sp.]|nr:AAA family ATPase [Henriciella sp.]
MSNENTLFDEDFEIEFDDDLDSDLSSVFEDDDDIAPTETVDLDATQKELESGVAFPEPEHSNSPEGGDRAIPAILAVAFCENGKTMELMEAVAADRRMSQASVEVHEGGLPAAIEYLQQHATPNLLLLESSAPMATMVNQIDELADHCDEGVQVMVIGATNDIALYRQLMARGVSEYLVPPATPVQVVRAIGNLFSDPDAPFVGRSISVVGAKGGVGSSTIAHNLAWALSEGVGVNTTLIDLDLSFGTTALDFNHESQQTVADALLAPERVDDAVISRLLAKATDRLSLFTAPASVSQLMEIPSEAYSIVIDGVRRVMPFVVLDLPHVWNQWSYETLVGSDEVILVCQPDLASLRNGKNMIDKISADRPNDAPPRVVINMIGVPKRPEIPVKDFAAAIGVEPDIALPFDPQLFGTASNNGQMISETDPKAKPSLALDHMAMLLTGRDVQQESRSFFKKLLGK